MRGRLTRGLAFAAIAGVVLIGVGAGCGGGDDDTLTKAQFIQQADAICKKGNKRIDAAAKQIFTTKQEPSKAQLTTFATDTLIPDVQGQVDDVRALNEPSEDEDEVNAFLDSAQSELDKGKEDPLYMTSDKSFSETNKLGKQYGFKVCSAD
jgi:hypothetical protein